MLVLAIHCKLFYIVNIHCKLPGGSGGRRDQENTVNGLVFEIKRCACAERLRVQKREFSTKRVLFSKSFRV